MLVNASERSFQKKKHAKTEVNAPYVLKQDTKNKAGHMVNALGVDVTRHS